MTAMKRRLAFAPALAAPVPVLGHILSEALASGHGVWAVAHEPSHLYELILSLLALPLWRRAAAARRLSASIFAFTAITLVFEGNGLSIPMLITALVLAAAMTLVADSAVKAALGAIACGARVLRNADRVAAVLPTTGHLSGPYYAFVAAHGNRPPPASPLL